MLAVCFEGIRIGVIALKVSFRAHKFVFPFNLIRACSAVCLHSIPCYYNFQKENQIILRGI